MTPEELKTLRSAYHALAVPESSSAVEIRRAFRRLAKTWHPDKWPQGGPPQVKAAERMREINAAFQAIRHAPLRYHIEGHPRVVSRAAAAGRPVRHETVPLTDHTELWLRFAAGAMLGVVVNVVVMCGGTDIPTALWVMVPIITGGLSAVLGNAFWNLVIESLWWIDWY